MRIINHDYADQNKKKMTFIIEEESFAHSVYAYKSSRIFDEMLEYYAFLNTWAVTEVDGEDTTEVWYLNHDKAIEISDELFDRT